MIFNPRSVTRLIAALYSWQMARGRQDTKRAVKTRGWAKLDYRLYTACLHLVREYEDKAKYMPPPLF